VQHWGQKKIRNKSELVEFAFIQAYNACTGGRRTMKERDSVPADQVWLSAIN